MILFYLFSLIPMFIGGILWACGKRIVLWEWAISSIIGFILSGAFHFLAFKGQTQDEEIHSGQIFQARQFSAWEESYQEAIYRTETYYTGMGKNRTRHTRKVFSHWASRKRWHDVNWRAFSNIPSQYSIDKNHFLKLEKAFGGSKAIAGDRKTMERNSRMIGGDPNDYVADNKTGYIEPVVEVRSFENRIKAAPSVFSFVKVPETIPVFSWPRPNSPWVTERVLGTAKGKISQREWDEMNAVLGPKCKINLILIGFSSEDSTLLQYQEAKFVGGRKNDLVISYAGNETKPTYVKVFGWTEDGLIKKNIESYILENGVNKNLISFLNTEIPQNYKPKDWKKFDYISVEPRVSYFYWFFAILVLTQGGLYWFFHINEFDKGLKHYTISSRVANL